MRRTCSQLDINISVLVAMTRMRAFLLLLLPCIVHAVNYMSGGATVLRGW